MSLEYWNNLQTGSDSCSNNFESSNGEGSVLFAKQPQSGTREPDFVPRYAPYPMFARRVRVFKNIATVPDITLNYAQTEGVMSLGNDSTMSPLLTDVPSSPNCTDVYCYSTSPLSSSPASVNSDLSPNTTSDQIVDPSLLFHSPPPLPFNSLCLSDNAWNVSPISATVDLPSLELFTETPSEPEFHELDSNLRKSSPVSTIDPVTNTNHNTVVLPDKEQKPTAKHCRYPSSEPEIESLSVFFPTRRKSTRAAKKALRNTKATSARKPQNKGPPRSHASDLSKYVLELSSENWLKLSPPLTTETSPHASHPSPPSSLSPSATPEPTNVRKRKRAMTSPSVTPLQSPLARLLSVDYDVEAPSPLSSAPNSSDEESEREGVDLAGDYIHQDFIAAMAMGQRRSERTRAPISYAGCDEDVPEQPARGKAKPAATRAKARSDDFKTQASRTAPKKSRRGGGKPPQNAKEKCECPFRIICSIPFGRFSDVVRHLESNVLHTHAEKARWECPNCGSRLARSDSYKRHVDARACGKRAPTEKVKPVYSPEVERELERIRDSDHPAVIAANERLRI